MKKKLSGPTFLQMKKNFNRYLNCKKRLQGVGEEAEVVVEDEGEVEHKSERYAGKATKSAL